MNKTFAHREGDLAAIARAARERAPREFVLGVFGGTFDPPHLGHVGVAQAAARSLGLDALLLLPAGNPNFKRDATVAPADARLYMCRLAARAIDGCPVYVSDLEICRAGVTFTVDTMRMLQSDLPKNVRLVFVLGADAFETLPSWHGFDELCHMAEFAVVPRAGGSRDLRAPAGVRWRVVDARVPDVSSTQVRKALAAGSDVAHMLPPGVGDYACKYGLYTEAVTGGDA